MNAKLPVDIVFHPSWWNKHAGIVFDKDFFYNPERRVKDEMKMENELYRRFGDLGLGENHDKELPQIGAIHNAAGYLLSEMLGCTVEYFNNSAPQVICAHHEGFDLDIEAPFNHPSFKALQQLIATLKTKYGYVCGDVNWGGILNLAIDLKGESIFLDMVMQPEECKAYFTKIAQVVERFLNYIHSETGSTSISVNSIARLVDKATYIHSECSHTMISAEDYQEFLLPFDVEWSKKFRPYGIHYCGKDPHRHAKQFAMISDLEFLDLGWGGDVALLREELPNTFFSIRLNPVDLNSYSHEELKNIIRERVLAAKDPYKTGICCVNMDDKVEDDKIRTIFKTVDELRQEM